MNNHDPQGFKFEKQQVERNTFKGFVTAGEFAASYKPPVHVVKGVIQQSRLYSFTGITGHGKSLIAIDLAIAIAQGVEWNGRKCKQGAVLFLAGENEDNIKAQFIATSDHLNIEPDTLAVHFHEGRFDIDRYIKDVRACAEKIGNVRLIIADTFQAFFTGDDESANVEMLKAAMIFRELTYLPSRPAVIVPSHPTKSATRQNLVPRGGSAFLNELDGNFTVWRDGDRIAFHHTKLRGAPFGPIRFEQAQISTGALMDEDGEIPPMAVVRPISEEQHESGQSTHRDDTAKVLRHINENPRTSLKEIGKLFGRDKRFAQGVADRLRNDELIEYKAGLWRVTSAGKRWLETYTTGFPGGGDGIPF